MATSKMSKTKAKLSLESLKPAVGSKQKRTRVGRGEGSGLGKTSGRGGKGQTARTGGTVKRHFEGGQMPLYRRLPKVGFTSRKRLLGTNQYAILKLSDLETFDNGAQISFDTLVEKGLAKSTQVKVLKNDGLTKKVNLVGIKVSASAKAHIESLGGSVA